MERTFISSCLMFAGLVSAAIAQSGTPTTRYMIQARSATVIQPSVFEATLPHPPVPPGEYVIYNDALHLTLAVLDLTAAESTNLLFSHREYIVEADQKMSSNSCETPDPSPTGWALQSLLSSLPCGLPTQPGCAPSQVTLYVVDSGVQKLVGATPHPQFDATSSVVWGTGLMTPSLTGSGASPFVDLHNHGTGVASTAIGKDTGLFSHLHGGSVKLEPCQIYYPSISPAQQPWVSDAVNVIYQASVQHLARKADASPLNNGSVLLFANRTQTTYSEIMERQLAEATNAGIVVVAAAGNGASAADPKTPSTTAPSLSMACFAPVMISQIATPPSSTKTPSGLPLSALLADPSQPCQNYATPLANYLLLVGATTASSELWASTPSSGSNYGVGASLFAPGSAVSKAASNSLSVSSGTGTSLSSGYVAGLALYYLSLRPWAGVAEVRTFIMNHTITGVPAPPGAEEGMVVRSLNLDGLIAPDCCLDYATWAGLKSLAGPQALKSMDPENDGLVNLLEWVLGDEPLAPSSNRGLSLNFHDGAYYLRLTLAPWECCGCTAAVEASTNLTNWTASVPAFFNVPQVNPELTGRVSEALLGTSPDRKFYRLRVTSP